MTTDPYRAYCRDIFLDDWDKVVRLYEEQRQRWDGWIFRGQPTRVDDLKTSIERVAIDRFGYSRSRVRAAEGGLIRRFRRQAHQYLQSLPREHEIIEWLALMQHFGAPTRLQDWTYSFFVALHFATRGAALRRMCTVWALDPDRLEKASLQHQDERMQLALASDVNLKDPDTSNALFWDQRPKLFVMPVNSFTLNERQSIQQGVFLAPGDVGTRFWDNLKAVLETDPTSKQWFVRIRIRCTRALVMDACKYLHRVNVNAATLFPGLSGFSEHLESLLAVDGALATDSCDVVT